jgi:hypothetical protein
MVREDNEVVHFQHVAEMFHSLIDSQQLSILGSVFLLCRVELLGEECQVLSRRSYSTAPMAEVEASVTSASGTAGSGCARKVACDKLALQSSKTLWRSGVQVIG